jgi:DNA invertase Pin-like site-specific DNA recombinase
VRAAIYARISTDKQRDASIDDQLRECEELCRREGFTIIARETDRGMSGESAERPGYERVLRAVARCDADVVVAHELTRLWRSQAEQYTQVEQFEFRGRHVVTCDGADTRRDGFEFLFAVKGAQAKTETKRIATRVHRTHKGLVLAGRSTDGRTYGYRSEPIYDATRKDAYGRPEIIGATRVIDPETAEIVRRIFAMYADGVSPRGIAARLNAEGVASPGAAWRRTTRRKDAKWLASAIHGDPKRASGILNCETYIGRVIWNRRQMKKRPRTSKRVAMMRTAADQIVREEPSLRIISNALWQRVKNRQTEQARRIGEGVKRGLSKAAALRAGAGNKYLLSGLLRCGHCGSSYAIAAKDRYACSGHTNGGDALCTNSAMLRRQVAEAEVTAGIKRDLRSPDVIEEICRRVRATLRETTRRAKPPDHAAPIAQLKAEIANLADAIASGVLRTSPTLAARLMATAEQELARLAAAQPTALRPRADVTRLLADLPRRAELAIDRLEETLAAGDVARARQEIKAHVGNVTVEADEHEIRLFSEQGVAAVLLRAVGGAHSSIDGSGGRI